MYAHPPTYDWEFEARYNIIRRELESAQSNLDSRNIMRDRLESAEQELFSRYEKIMKLRDALQRLYDAVEADDGIADWHMKRAESALAETEMENDDD